jgi:hypothetical protein
LAPHGEGANVEANLRVRNNNTAAAGTSEVHQALCILSC